MKAIQLSNATGGVTLVEVDVSKPAAAPGEVLVKVHAAGVIHTELGWYPTTHTKTGEPRTGAVPGHEFSGVVAAVGDGVTGIDVGQEIYGMNDWFADGATAEYCVTLPGSIAAKPKSLTHVEAASVPISALTAWQGLFDRAKLQAGERVLVHGGAGAVGIFIVQLARSRGAHVIATASEHTLAFVSELGVDEVIDYQKEQFEDRVRKVDIVFDTVGGETLQRSWGVLKPEGRMVTIASDVEGTDDPKLKAAFFIVEPNRDQLTEVARMLDAGTLRTFVGATVPLEKAEEAYAGDYVKGGPGKIVVVVKE
ncbi:NADPH:quinone reductase-like Zn-dependent oxidoreductase [Edaphobacter aggregans]|uniref:NADPH:quinone reductase-like Zn-dependent oxidoreductase n=1 Tax=Edaphobacter aggregans TaxID=570835 RepID=A0A428MKP6_9BACT|nr:NADP-dependent oxidoreductase [Edaphobacter aggregans]RSL17427.1 NADPH:quinone reductase-like Zn-dependent oxidoreductase [Edaphobacter aggregans]